MPVGLERRSFVLPRRVIVHLGRHPLEEIGGDPTYLATCRAGAILLVKCVDDCLTQARDGRDDLSPDT